MPLMPLDRIDYRILHHLQNDGRLTNLELAERVGLSPSPCLRRVRALEEAGILIRYVGIVDAKAVGLPISAFINVSLRSQEVGALDAFQAAVKSFPEVMECYLMTGDSDYLLRVVVPDLKALQCFIVDRLARIPDVSNIRSSVAIKQIKYKTALPIELG